MSTIKEQLSEKLKNNYDEYERECLAKTPQEIIENAQRIYFAQQIYKNTADVVNDNEAEYLLQFKNPLEILCDSLESSVSVDLIYADDTFSYLVGNLADQQSADYDYEKDSDITEKEDMEMCLS